MFVFFFSFFVFSLGFANCFEHNLLALASIIVDFELDLIPPKELVDDCSLKWQNSPSRCYRGRVTSRRFACRLRVATSTPRTCRTRIVAPSPTPAVRAAEPDPRTTAHRGFEVQVLASRFEDHVFQTTKISDDETMKMTPKKTKKEFIEFEND